jgi:hypothetical protein
MQTISRLRLIITYFKKSSFAKRHLTAFRVYMDIKTGIVSIGDTIFLTLYHSGSVATVDDRCFLKFWNSVRNKV